MKQQIWSLSTHRKKKKFMFQSSSKQSLMILFLKTLTRTPIQAKQFSKTIKMIIKIKFKRHMKKTNASKATNWNKINKQTVLSSSIRMTTGKKNTEKTTIRTKMMSLRNRISQTKPSINSSILLTLNHNKMLTQRASFKKT